MESVMGSAKVSGIPADVTDDPALTVRAPGPTIAEAKAQHVPDEKTQGSVTRPESTAVQCAVASANRKTFEARMRSEEHTSELQSLMRISYAVFCLKKTKDRKQQTTVTYRSTTVTGDATTYSNST